MSIRFERLGIRRFYRTMCYTFGMIFETDRLIVREWRDEDAEDAYRIYSEPEVNKGIMGTEPTSVMEMRERLANIRQRWSHLDRLGVWAVELKSESRVVATCLLKPLPNSELIEVGWHVGMSDWGNGYATEFGEAAVRHGFETVGLDAIYAIVFPWNAASLRVCNKIGLKHQGQTTEFHEHELEFFRILPQEFSRP